MISWELMGVDGTAASYFRGALLLFSSGKLFELITTRRITNSKFKSFTGMYLTSFYLFPSSRALQLSQFDPQTAADRFYRQVLQQEDGSLLKSHAMHGGGQWDEIGHTSLCLEGGHWHKPNWYSEELMRRALAVEDLDENRRTPTMEVIPPRFSFLCCHMILRMFTLVLTLTHHIRTTNVHGTSSAAIPRHIHCDTCRFSALRGHEWSDIIIKLQYIIWPMISQSFFRKRNSIR